MSYFHENFEETFTKFWRNSLKVTKENEKVVRNLKTKNRKYLLVLIVQLVTDEKNSKNNYLKNRRNRLRLIISNSLSIIDRSELIDNYQSVSIFLTTLLPFLLKNQHKLKIHNCNVNICESTLVIASIEKIWYQYFFLVFYVGLWFGRSDNLLYMEENLIKISPVR